VVVAEMEREGVAADQSTYNTLMAVCAQHGRWEHAIQVSGRRCCPMLPLFSCVVEITPGMKIPPLAKACARCGHHSATLWIYLLPQTSDGRDVSSSFIR
jgi:pentatricopeptide repeat protein